jgi:hypothetical protein
MSVVIEEVPEDTPASAPKKRKQYEDFEKTMTTFKKVYTNIHKLRAQGDFMYMFLTGENEIEKEVFLSTLVRNIKETYQSNINEAGITGEEHTILDRIMMTKDSDSQDCLWFLALDNLKSLSYWVLNGDPAKNKLPPPLPNREWFKYFIQNDNFKDICNNFLEGKMDVKAFVIAMRSEYFMTTGCRDVGAIIYDDNSDNKAIAYH